MKQGMRKHRFWTKLAAFILAAAMVLGALPMGALAEAAPELLDEILAVWGDQPAAMDGAEILEPFPTVEESVESLKAQMTDAQMALVEAYEATDGQNTDDLLALAEVYESMLALQARVEALEGGEQVNG